MHSHDKDVPSAELEKKIIYMFFVCFFLCLFVCFYWVSVFFSSTFIQSWCLFNVWKPDGLFSHLSHWPDSPGPGMAPVKAGGQEVFTTQKPPFQRFQCTLIVAFFVEEKNMHICWQAALYIFTRLFYNSGRKSPYFN